jgi:hypothetical protein
MKKKVTWREKKNRNFTQIPKSVCKSVSTPTSYIKNLSNLELSTDEINVLSKGLKFIPSPGEPRFYDLAKALADLRRSMNLRIYFRNNNRDAIPFVTKSNWNPPILESMPLKNYFNKTKYELKRLQTQRIENNLSHRERHALRSLKNNHNTIIKPADKGRAVVILKREDYISTVEKHLMTKHYKKLQYNPMDMLHQRVQLKCLELRNTGQIESKTYAFLKQKREELRTPTIYMLPKIHKQTHNDEKFVGRPITSACGGPCERISELADYFLLPIVKNQKTYMRDSHELLNILKTLKLSPNVLLVSMDIVSMYTNIPLREAIDVNLKAYDASVFQYKIKKINTLDFGEILELILENNFLEFNGTFYKEEIGLAQGSKCSPEIADIYLHSLEERFLSQIPKLIMYRRYRDDIFILSEAEEKDLISFLEKINKMHESLKSTIEISNHQLNFLDLTIYKGENFRKSGMLDTKTYFKPTETFQYIQASSAHPSFCLKGFVKGEILRHKRNCNNVPVFMKTTLIFYKYLRQRGYSRALFWNN